MTPCSNLILNGRLFLIFHTAILFHCSENLVKQQYLLVGNYRIFWRKILIAVQSVMGCIYSNYFIKGRGIFCWKSYVVNYEPVSNGLVQLIITISKVAWVYTPIVLCRTRSYGQNIWILRICKTEYSLLVWH